MTGENMKKMIREYNTFSTADLGIATFLLTKGHELKDATLQGPKRLIFHFEQQADTETQIPQYLNGTGEASAKKLFENYRALRALAFSKTGNLR